MYNFHSPPQPDDLDSMTTNRSRVCSRGMSGMSTWSLLSQVSPVMAYANKKSMESTDVHIGLAYRIQSVEIYLSRYNQ
ncbi:hypothetical protein ACTXT7_010453 [Hymenolepis weldensis]